MQLLLDVLIGLLTYLRALVSTWSILDRFWKLLLLLRLGVWRFFLITAKIFNPEILTVSLLEGLDHILFNNLLSDVIHLFGCDHSNIAVLFRCLAVEGDIAGHTRLRLCHHISF